jgi:hypothetical protein
VIRPPEPIDDLSKARTDRQRRDLATQCATGKLTMEAFTAAVSALKADHLPQRRRSPSVPTRRCGRSIIAKT